MSLLEKGLSSTRQLFSQEGLELDLREEPETEGLLTTLLTQVDEYFLLDLLVLLRHFEHPGRHII